MWDKKAFPKPWPSAAPFTSPAISTTFKNAGTLLKKIIKGVCIILYIIVYWIIDKQ